MHVAEIVRAAVEKLAVPHRTSTYQSVTVSIGVATVTPGDSQPQDDLLEAADAALYAAKRQGRNTVVEHALVPAAKQQMSLAG